VFIILRKNRKFMVVKKVLVSPLLVSPGISELQHDLHEDVGAGAPLLPLPGVHIVQ
jgi:hypothetical protein